MWEARKSSCSRALIVKVSGECWLLPTYFIISSTRKIGASKMSVSCGTELSDEEFSPSGQGFDFNFAVSSPPLS